jgi:hypothetical protein
MESFELNFANLGEVLESLSLNYKFVEHFGNVFKLHKTSFATLFGICANNILNCWKQI